jgi:hypothetical protein
MQVKIKSFDTGPIEILNNGIELGIRSPNGATQLGDLIITKTRLEWCQGRTRAGNGVQKTWQEFIDWMNS